MEFHHAQLEKSCRVCGRRLKTARGNGRSFDCLKFHIEIKHTFSIDISSDDPATHPLQFCFSCHGVICRKASALKKGVPFSSPAIHNHFHWSGHSDDSCNVRIRTLIFTHTLNTLYRFAITSTRPSLVVVKTRGILQHRAGPRGYHPPQ